MSGLCAYKVNLRLSQIHCKMHLWVSACHIFFQLHGSFIITCTIKCHVVSCFNIVFMYNTLPHCALKWASVSVTCLRKCILTAGERRRVLWWDSRETGEGLIKLDVMIRLWLWRTAETKRMSLSCALWLSVFLSLSLHHCEMSERRAGGRNRDRDVELKTRCQICYPAHLAVRKVSTYWIKCFYFYEMSLHF